MWHMMHADVLEVVWEAQEIRLPAVLSQQCLVSDKQQALLKNVHYRL